jgi:hypothetical protein
MVLSFPAKSGERRRFGCTTLDCTTLPAPTVTACLTAVQRRLPTSVRLLSFHFRLVSVLLLLLQIAGYIRVWRRRWNFTSLSLGIWSGR